jgi:hypothetical protein
MAVSVAKLVAGSLLSRIGVAQTTKLVAGSLLDGRTWISIPKLVAGSLLDAAPVTPEPERRRISMFVLT